VGAVISAATEMRTERRLDERARIELVSTDVFDTLLLRTLRSERSRLKLGEALFSELLAREGVHISPDVLLDARLEAQRLAFRSMSLSQRPTEVRVADVIVRQVSLVGAPQHLVAERLRIEIAVEKMSLRANRRLAATLRRRRAEGARIVAVSDTTLCGRDLRELIAAFHGPDLVDAIYSSADHGRTKRAGDLFDFVAREEGTRPGAWLHIGDDFLADFKVPASKGLAVAHLARSALLGWLRKADGALTEMQRAARKQFGPRGVSAGQMERAAFGRDVLGPIVAQFCQRIWLYAAQAEASDAAVLLFCARGGVGIRAVFERVLAKLDLPLRMRRENFLISRLVAARAALLTKSPSALQELDREFSGATLADVAKALGGRAYDLPREWERTFDGALFLDLLFGASGGEALADIRAQNALFETHLKEVARSAERLILCDTGLYGSTQRLLASAYPHLGFETIQFARCNYKGHSEEHFPKTVGLQVERNRYSPFDVTSCVLRYWQLVESAFEPARASVRSFSRDAQGAVVANCGDLSYGAFDPSVGNPLLEGLLAYVDGLPRGGGAVVYRDVDRAWRRLKCAIVRPTTAELRCLDVGSRSRDFGRTDTVQVVAAHGAGLRDRLAAIKLQLWREGAVTREFPLLRHLLLPVLEFTHSMRALAFRRSD
jgi:FMN phosphatase YigB (HAD superfamily)